MKTFLCYFILFLISSMLNAQLPDLGRASVMSVEQTPVRETCVRVLLEETEKRSGVKLKRIHKWDMGTVIVLAYSSENEVYGRKVPAREGAVFPENRPEGYRILAEKTVSGDVLWLLGADDRGIFYAIGHLLRNAEMSRNRIKFEFSGDLSSSPVYSIRGHQLGYRNTANSWDAWTVAQYEQYIRELALTGSNCIENIPFQDGPAGPNMKVPYEQMNISLSEICSRYGLNYWVWTPSGEDLSDTAAFAREVKKHTALYKSCPKLDAVFFPGGDPGNNHPEHVMPFLKEISAGLKKYHPEAGVWISLQGFSDEETEYFFEYLRDNNPDWLEGVVSGPGSPDIAATRYRLAAKYRHRHYGDITHSVRCQYPVENWDQAFALTEGREVCNPRPFFYARVHNRFAPFTDGFLSYSDGVHDDVNKVLWNRLGWDPDTDVRRIIVEYSRLFFGYGDSEKIADAILALERNWSGPLEENGGVEATFSLWQGLEKAHPELLADWRWQLLLSRAYYDTYTRRRKIYEQNLEKEANETLLLASETGSENAMNKALEIVNRADSRRISPELRTRITDLCDDLYRSVGLQTSVKKYNASGAERGAILDFLDYPLNNRWWLADEFDKIHKMQSEKEKIERLAIIARWENPGKGSYYDNVSDIAKGPRVKTRSEDATDIAWWDNGMSRKRLSTQLFQNSPVIEYPDLDPDGIYTIRIAGYGDALLRIDGERVEPVIYNKGLEEFKEFCVARHFVSDGFIRISFDQPEESHLNWRQHSKICDVWLLKK